MAFFLTQVVRLLLKRGVDRALGGKGGLTALHAACHCGHPKVVKLLAEAEAETDGERKPHPALELPADGGVAAAATYCRLPLRSPPLATCCRRLC